MTQRISNVSLFKTTVLFIFIAAFASISGYAGKASPAASDFNHVRLIHTPEQGDFIELTNASGEANGARFGSDAAIRLTIIPVEGTGWIAVRLNKHYVRECTVSGKNTCLINVDGLNVTGFSLIKLAKGSDISARKGAFSAGTPRNGQRANIF